MVRALVTIFTVPDLRKKILFTLGMLLLFRIGAHITVPGLDFKVLQDYFSKAAAGQGGNLTDYIDLFAGGAFKRLSVFALGIMPYISASIIMQIMMVAVPSLQRLAKEGDFGRRKINQYTRYGTVLLCALQAYGITVYITSLHFEAMQSGKGMLIPGGPGAGFTAMTMLTITAGTILLMWMGELMTERGIGNGTSLIIFAGIIAGAPAALGQFLGDIKNNQADAVLALILLVLFIAMIGFSILLSEGQRKIPLQYGKRIVGRRMVQGASQTLPIKVNAANVMPIIFASSLMIFPSQIASYFGSRYQGFAETIQKYLAPGTLTYFIIYILLILFFAYFYTTIQYNPKEIAEALKKNGGYIPGVRPGAHTEETLERILNRITLSGAIFLAFVAIAPDIFIKLWSLEKYSQLIHLFGGTSLLITVGVALDTLKQIESQLIMRHYDGFMDRNKKSAGRPRVVR
ncbi:MAG: preprotein translocase subunit SecY [Spirochaetota bacterium]